MKALLFLLLFPVAAFADSYNYDKVVSLNRGSDNFAFDQVKTSENVGAIEFTGDKLSIDGKTIELKAESPNRFKSKKCSVELVYKSGSLAMVKMYKANSVTCYMISNTEGLVTKK
jgi:hypothetical protein